MTEAIEHLDRALAQEFTGHAETIHRLKMSDGHFRQLMEQNHALWSEIQYIHNGVHVAEDSVRRDLEKRRLAVLDEIGVFIRRAEAH